MENARAEAFEPGYWLGLDVGGANLKAALGHEAARTASFEVWKRPAELGRALAALASGFPQARGVALTMTAESCDCYPTRSAGTAAVLDAVVEAFPRRPIAVWGLDGAFHSVEEARATPRLAASANWLALATIAARTFPEVPALLIDIGTTTTDLVPLDRGAVAARGGGDTDRLQSGELVYAGTRRTPVCALAFELPFRGKLTRLAAELFATTLDVYLTLGDIAPGPNDRSTADGRPATIDAARDRLARMVGADRDGFTPDDALALARAIDEELSNRLLMAAERACDPVIERPRAAIVSGSGAFLARRIAERWIGPDRPIVALDELWGGAASSAACAFAVAWLAEERSPMGLEDRRQAERGHSHE